MSLEATLRQAIADLELEASRIEASLVQLRGLLGDAASTTPAGTSATPLAMKASTKTMWMTPPAPRAAKATRRGGKLASREDEIKRRYVAGENVRAMAREMKCTDASIHGLAKRRGWERKAATAGDVPVRKIPRGVSGRPE